MHHDRCPVRCCQLELENIAKRQRNSHIPEGPSKRSDKPAPFPTVRSPLQSPILSSTTYYHTLVRPGFCPFCSGDPDLPVTQRLVSWTRDGNMWKRVSDHVQNCTWPTICPYPGCKNEVEDEQSLESHFIDEHKMSQHPKPRNTALGDRKREREHDDDAENEDSDGQTVVASSHTVTAAKKARSESSKSSGVVSLIDDPDFLDLEATDDQITTAIVTPQEVERNTDVTRLSIQSPTVETSDDDELFELIRSPSPDFSDETDAMLLPTEPNQAGHEPTQLPLTRPKLSVQTPPAKIMLRFPAFKSKEREKPHKREKVRKKEKSTTLTRHRNTRT